MKKRLLVLLASMMTLSFASCNQTSSPSDSQPIKPSDEVSSEISSNEEVSTGFDESKYTAHKFIAVEDLYLIENEAYYLNKMPFDNQSLDGLNYYCDLQEYASVSEDGVVTASSLNGELNAIGNIYVYDDTKLQKIKLTVCDYYEYGSYFMSVDLGRLYNKKVMFLGDSITHNWSARQHERPDPNVISDDPRNFTNLGTNYVKMLADACNFESVVNAAWSGGTMAYLPKSGERFTYKSFGGSVCENLEATADADYIFVFYGTNDLTDQVNIGSLQDPSASLEDKQNSSFYAGMKFGVNKIREVNPDANIIFMNLFARSYPYSGNNKLDDYNAAIEEFCKAYMTKLLDINSLYTNEEFAVGSGLTNDGLHPQEKAYRKLTDYILTGVNSKDE